MFKEKESIYTNDKVKALIAQRNELNRQIVNEIEKEKAKYKFSRKRFSFFVGAITLCIFGLWFNYTYIPKNSIWSWEYYSKEMIIGGSVAFYLLFGFGIAIKNSFKRINRK